MNYKNEDGSPMSPEQIEEHMRKQFRLSNALKDELAEIVIRYANAKLEPDLMVGYFVSAAMKVESSASLAVLASKHLSKSPNADALIKALKDVREEFEKRKDKNDAQ